MKLMRLYSFWQLHYPATLWRVIHLGSVWNNSNRIMSYRFLKERLHWEVLTTKPWK